MAFAAGNCPMAEVLRLIYEELYAGLPLDIMKCIFSIVGLNLLFQPGYSILQSPDFSLEFVDGVCIGIH
jgi:hypothetical protein